MDYDNMTVYAPSTDGTGPVRKIADVDSAALLESLSPYIEKLNADNRRIGIRTANGQEVNWFFDLGGNPNNIKPDDFTTWAPGTELLKKVTEDIGVRPAGRIRLMLMLPERCLSFHTDRDRWRVHIPLVTNPMSFFIVHGKLWHLPLGGAYLVKVEDYHTALNGGYTDRIHIVIDLCANLA